MVKSFLGRFLSIQKQIEELEMDLEGIRALRYEPLRRSTLERHLMRERYLMERLDAMEDKRDTVEAQIRSRVGRIKDKKIRDTLLMAYLEGKSNAEIAKALGVTPRQVGRLKERGYKQLPL